MKLGHFYANYLRLNLIKYKRLTNMKKTILTVLGMMFIASSAYAASIGISGTALYYDASGTETTKSSSELNEKSDSGFAPVPSIFIEQENAQGGVIGLEIIPYGAKVADFDNAKTDKSEDNSSGASVNNKGDINFNQAITLYIEQPFDGPIDGGFIKFGLSSIQIETEESLGTGSSYGDERVMGLMVGFGKRTERADGTFVKVVGEVSRYQGATFEGDNDSDSVRNSIELDDFTTAGIRVSVGKSF